MAVECPTKLFYTGKSSDYADANLDDPFLKALARGGFQVGALAKCYYPEGIEVVEQNHDKAVEATNRLLKAENVTIFEAAIRHENLFVRVDVLKKVGNTLQVIEVKSKSFDPTAENPFFDKAALKKNIRKLSAEFAPYLYDIAFQAYVCRKTFPKSSVSSFLLLPSKAARTSVEGLNQNFLLKDGPDGRPGVVVKQGVSKADLGDEILHKVNVDEVVAIIHAGQNTERSQTDRCNGLGYEDEIAFFARMYVEDNRIPATPSSHCKHCEFRAAAGDGLKSGFNECWQTMTKEHAPDLGGAMVFDIWNFRKSDALIEDGKVFVRDLVEEDVSPTAKSDEEGLSMSQRQWLQVQYVQTKKKDPYLDSKGLSSAIQSWRFPLHFIDFETTMVAIPFNKDRRPYEVVAFQFSHHVVHEDGLVEHLDQYLSTERGRFPNFDFVRALKRSLERDQGTIFRYAAHENTVLCQIHEQLRASNEPDAQDLMAWIRTITTSGSSSKEKWSGPRSMVDLCDLVKRFYYHPMTNGSNSIKQVLPAILNSSKYLQEKYSKPIYGAPNGIKSLNFSERAWIEVDQDGSVKDPYERLPSIYRDISRNEMDRLFGDDELADGGAAMMTYAMMQFTEMAEPERQALASALLRYCELDTLAMVMLYEYWVDVLGLAKGKRAA
jgi:hypothetical protein